MRRFFVCAAAFAALLGATPAAAQQETGDACASFTSGPRIPNGETASNAAMVSARGAVDAWRSTRQAEVEACRAAIERVQAQLNAMQTAHNQAVTETDTVIAQFAAENAEYAARRRGRDASRRN